MRRRECKGAFVDPPDTSRLRDLPCRVLKIEESSQKHSLKEKVGKTHAIRDSLFHHLRLRRAQFPSLYISTSDWQADSHNRKIRYLSHSSISSKACLHVIGIVSCIVVPVEHQDSKLRRRYSARANHHHDSLD